MATPLTIFAHIEADADQVKLVKTELLKLIDITREEEGCINYDLYQDNDNPAVFKFYENWQSRELWQTHMANTHLERYMQATEGKVAKFELREMSGIS